MRYIYLATIFLAFASHTICAQTEPVWTAIPMPYFFDYSTRPQPSQAGSGPYNLLFSLLPAQTGDNDALGCYWNNYAGHATGNSATGTNPSPPTYPYWFTGSKLNSGPISRSGFSGVGLAFEDPIEVGTAMKGVSFEGAYYSGVVQGGGDPNAAVFWESDDCADGDTEYGFSFQTGASTFYYSYWSNCYEGDCYLNDNLNTPVTQCGGGFTLPNLTSSTGKFYYNAFPYQAEQGAPWEFRAEVLDSGNYNTLYWCDVNPSSASPFTCMYPPPYSQNNMTALTPTSQPTKCTVVPSGNTTTSFNPGWVDEVYGSLFAVIAGGSTSPYVSVNGVETVPFQITVVKAGK
jgi:hypothetical protein